MTTLVDTCSCGAPLSMLPRDHVCATPTASGLEAAQDERMARALRLRAEMDGPDMPGGYYRQRADSIIFALAAHSVVPSEGMRVALFEIERAIAAALCDGLIPLTRPRLEAAHDAINTIIDRNSSEKRNG